jgi:hypothetical protein
MAIILEGFDNSGKSTLASKLGFEILHPGPRPKDWVEEHDCLMTQKIRAHLRLVMDRVTCISTPCYTGEDWPRFKVWASKMIDTPHCVVVYCRPPLEVIKDFDKHVVKTYDEANQVKWLKDNADRIVDNYDTMMQGIPHMRYDYTNPDESVVELAMAAQMSVEDWNLWRALT